MDFIDKCFTCILHYQILLGTVSVSLVDLKLKFPKKTKTFSCVNEQSWWGKRNHGMDKEM